MKLASKKVIKKLLGRFRIKPLKRFGQNFLIDPRIIKKIIKAAELSPQDLILEIGPGVGTLTQQLALKAKKVIAVEKDPKMVEILKQTLSDFKNVKIIQEDILKFKPKNEKLQIRNYKIVANLPYFLVSPVIRQFLETIEDRPLYLILMVQKEQAQRICAQPPEMNLLAIFVQFYASPKIISFVSKKSFWPQPKVDGAIIKITPNGKKNAMTELLPSERELFFKIVRAGFSHPRKQLINNLSKKLKIEREKIKNWLLKNNIQPSQRAETLDLKDWIKLTKNFKMN